MVIIKELARIAHAGMEKVVCNGWGLRGAEAFQKVLAEEGACSRIIGRGGDVDLQRIIDNSILALRAGRGFSPIGGPTRLESSLLENSGIDGIRVLSVLDLDGIIVSPANIACRFLEELAKGRPGPLIENLLATGRISRDNLLALKEISGLADDTYIWTSRFFVKKRFERFLGPLDGRISYFPFMTETSADRITEWTAGGGTKGSGRGAKVITNKTLVGDPGLTLDRLILNEDGVSKYDLVYYAGSSPRDRKAVEGFLRRHPELAERIVFLDGAHLFL